jgi:hypothetical protein
MGCDRTATSSSYAKRTLPRVTDLTGLGLSRKSDKEIRDDNDTSGTHTTDNAPGGTR